MNECHDCNGPIGKDNGPTDGWQLEDGRTVCQACCVEDTKANIALFNTITFDEAASRFRSRLLSELTSINKASNQCQSCGPNATYELELLGNGRCSSCRRLVDDRGQI